MGREELPLSLCVQVLCLTSSDKTSEEALEEKWQTEGGKKKKDVGFDFSRDASSETKQTRGESKREEETGKKERKRLERKRMIREKKERNKEIRRKEEECQEEIDLFFFLYSCLMIFFFFSSFACLQWPETERGVRERRCDVEREERKKKREERKKKKDSFVV